MYFIMILYSRSRTNVQVEGEVIWKRLYNCSSANEGDTLFQLRNLINRQNVFKIPKNAVTQCEEFFLLVVKAHIVCAAMTLFGMASVEDEPAASDIVAKNWSPNSEGISWGWLPKELLTSMLTFPYPSTRSVEKLLKILASQRTSARPKGHACKSKTPSRKTHPSQAADECSDLVLEYASETLTLGLFLMEFIDAIREGDGHRIIQCWRFFLLLFKASNRKNYSIEAFTLLCQFHFIFSECMKQQLVWSRTVNIHGCPGKNVSMDLHMEHLNRECKASISGLGANITEQAVKRVGKCLGETNQNNKKL